MHDLVSCQASNTGFPIQFLLWLHVHAFEGSLKLLLLRIDGLYAKIIIILIHAANSV